MASYHFASPGIVALVDQLMQRALAVLDLLLLVDSCFIQVFEFHSCFFLYFIIINNNNLQNSGEFEKIGLFSSFHIDLAFNLREV